MADNKADKLKAALDETKKRARKTAANLGEKAKDAGRKLAAYARDAKNRRKMDGVEVVAGSAVAGVLDGMGVTIDLGMVEVPAGLLIGGVGLVAGSYTKQPDVEALALGMLAYGVGSMARGYVEDMAGETPATPAA